MKIISTAELNHLIDVMQKYDPAITIEDMQNSLTITGAFFNDQLQDRLIQALYQHPSICDNLHYLIIEHTSITQAPDVSGLKNLAQLSLDRNQALVVAGDVANCKNLKWYHLQPYAEIDSAPSGLKHCHNLKLIWTNYYSTFPIDLSACGGSLQGLCIKTNLDHRNRYVLPIGFDQCTGLSNCTLSDPIHGNNPENSYLTKLALIELGIIYRSYPFVNQQWHNGVRWTPFKDWLPHVSQYLNNNDNQQPLSMEIISNHFQVVLKQERDRFNTRTMNAIAHNTAIATVARTKDVTTELTTRVMLFLAPAVDNNIEQRINAEFAMMQRIFAEFSADLALINNFEVQHKQAMINLGCKFAISRAENAVQSEEMIVAKVRQRLRNV